MISVPVYLRNRSNVAKNEIVTHGLRLLPGQLSSRSTQLKLLDVDFERQIQWEPYGETYPDGSFAQIAVHYPAVFSALEKRDANIVFGTGIEVPFALHTSVSGAASSTIFTLTVEGESKSVSLATILATSLVSNDTADGKIGSDTNACLRRYIYRERWSSVTNQQLRGVWWEIAYEAKSNLDHGKVYITWGYSWAESGIRLGNSWNDKTLTLTTPATLQITGAKSFFIAETKKFNSISRAGTTATYTLIDPSDWTTGFDYQHRNLVQGMSHHIAGELLFGSQSIPTTDAQREGVTAMASDWPLKGIPPFGVVPDLPDGVSYEDAIVKLEQWEDELYSKGRDADPYFWGDSIGNANTGQTGNAGIVHGTMRLWFVLRTGYPAALGALLRDIRQEFCRPNNNRLPNSTADLWSYASFPDLALWQGVPFYLSESSRSIDMLGINGPSGLLGIADFDCPYTQVNGAVYAFDRQHGMLMVEMTVALITADYSVLQYFKNMEQVWLGNADPHSYNDTIRGIEVGRAAGRGILHCGIDIFAVRGTTGVFPYLLDRAITIYSGMDLISSQSYQHSPVRTGVNPYYDTMGGYDEANGAQAGNLQNTGHNYCWMDSIVSIAGDGCQLVMSRRPETSGDYRLNLLKTITRDLALQTTLYGWLDCSHTAPNFYKAVAVGNDPAIFSPNYSGLILNKTLSGTVSNAVGTIVGYIELESTYAFWLKNVTGTFCQAGAEQLRIINSTYITTGQYEYSGFVAMKARAITPTYTPFTASQLEEVVLLEAYQPHGSNNAILDVEKNSNPLVTLVGPSDAHFLYDNAVVRIKNDPTWTGLNGDWTVSVVNQYQVRLSGLNTSSFPGTYVSTSTTEIYRLEWLMRNFKTYTAYNVWQIGSAVLAEDYAKSGYYSGKSSEVQAKARKIINSFSGQVDDVPTGIPKWNELAEHAATRFDAFNPAGGTPPEAPTSPSLTTLSQTELYLTWVNVATNATVINIQYRETASPTWLDYPDVSPNVSNTVVAGLTAGTSYTVRLRAANNYGQSSWTEEVSATTSSETTVPNAPTNLNIVTLSSTRLRASWTNNANNAEIITVQYKQADASDWISLPSLSPSSTYTTIYNLTPDTYYDVRVRATNIAGSSEWAQALGHTSEGDEMEPTILTSDPANAAEDVYINKNLIVTFVNPVLSSSVTENTVILIDTITNRRLPLTLSLNTFRTVLVIVPHNHLKENTAYRLMFIGQDTAVNNEYLIDSSSGLGLSTTTSIEFETGDSAYSIDSALQKDAQALTLEGDLNLPSNVKALGYDFTITKVRPKNYSAGNSVNLTGDNTIRFTFNKALQTGQDIDVISEVTTYPLFDYSYLAVSGSVGTYTIPTLTGYISGSDLVFGFTGNMPNNVGINIKLKDTLLAEDTATYGGNMDYNITTSIYPDIVPTNLIKLELKSLSPELYDTYVSTIIFKNAIELWERIGRGFDFGSISWPVKKYVINASVLDIIEDADLEKFLAAGTRKQVEDMYLSVDSLVGRLAMKVASATKDRDIAWESLNQGWQFKTAVRSAFVDGQELGSRLWYNANGNYVYPYAKFYQADMPASNIDINRQAKSNNPSDIGYLF